MSEMLQYNYARIDAAGKCTGVFTASYLIPDDVPGYVLIPDATTDYRDKYYNLNGDQLWYWDAEFTELWVECPSHNV